MFIDQSGRWADSRCHWGPSFTLLLEPYDIPTKIVDIRARGIIMENSIDLAPENNLLGNSTIRVFPDLNSEARESCQFNSDFTETLDWLKEIVKFHRKTHFQPFDCEGLRVQPLKLKVNPLILRLSGWNHVAL